MVSAHEPPLEEPCENADSDPGGLGQDLRFGISNKLPGSPKLLVRGPPLEDPGSGEALLR